MPESQTTTIISDELPVNSRIADFGFSRADFKKICEAVAHGRNLKTSLQPKTSEGQLKYIFGVEGMREVALASKAIKYEVFSKNNIEGVFDAANGVKIMFQMVDRACTKSHPQPKSKIGEGKRKFIEKSNQGFLFPEMEAEEDNRIEFVNALEGADCFYVMISISENDAFDCELTRLRGVTDDAFSDFIERIWILKDGEFVIGDTDADETNDTFEIKPQITKKK